jgi:hypothetical protein
LSSDISSAITKAEAAATGKSSAQTSALKSVLTKLASIGDSNADTAIYDASKTFLGASVVENTLSSNTVGLTKTAASTIDIVPARADILALNLESAAAKDTSLPEKVAKSLQTELTTMKYTQAQIDNVITYIDPSGVPGVTADYQKAFTELENLGTGVTGQEVLQDAKVISKVDIAKLPEEAVIKDIVAKSTADDLLTTPKASTLAAQSKWTIARSVASVASMALIMLVTDCDFRPSQAALNPEMLNHFIVYSQPLNDWVLPGAFNEPSMTRVCYAQNGLSVSEPVAKDGTCVTLDSSFCPSLQYSSATKGTYKPTCVALARSEKIDNLNGYTLFLGVTNNNNEKDNLRFISSLFNSYTKPIETSKYPVYRRSSQIDPGIIGSLIGQKPNGAFTFIAG